MFCLTGLGCADDAGALSDGDGVAPEVAARQAPSVSSHGYQWPEKCDAVYRTTVDNNGKGPKQKIPAGRETHPQIIVDASCGNEDLHAIAFRPIRSSPTCAATRSPVLHDAPFNFEEQTSEPIKDGPLELKTGDVIKTTCSFKNTTNRRVTFGESTEDEMCFNFAAYYRRKALSCSGFGSLGS